MVNVIGDDDWVVNENDDDSEVNKFVFAVMNDMVIGVNEHVLEMRFDAFSMDFQFNLIIVIIENTIHNYSQVSHKIFHQKTETRNCSTDFQQVSRQYCQNLFEKIILCRYAKIYL